MEVKINREIRNYTESMFFGLSLRQFIFSLFACGVAVLMYFILRPYLGIETLSWMCILAVAPFAALGFVKYNGMTAEKFAWAYVKSEFLIPKRLTFHSTNTYYEAMRGVLNQFSSGIVTKKSSQKSKSRLLLDAFMKIAQKGGNKRYD